jgi:hypothetical protein
MLRYRFFAVLFAIAGVLIYSYKSLKSERPSPALSECVLRYMRGQAAELRPYAVSLCEKEVADDKIKADLAKAWAPDPPQALPPELQAPSPGLDMKRLEEAARIYIPNR